VAESFIVTSSRSLSQPDRASEYPLQKRFLIYGVAAGISGFIVFQSLLAGFAFLVLFACVGGTWRRDGAAILPYCLAYQWLFVVAGYLFQSWAGIYPGFGKVEEIERAVFWSLVGLIAIVAGIRIGLLALSKWTSQTRSRLQEPRQEYDLKMLFWCVIVFYSVSWFIEISPMDTAFNVAQIIYRILEFRTVFLFMLFLSIVRRRKGYTYGFIALVYTTVPAFSSQMSAFSGSFLLIFIALLSGLRFDSKMRTDRRRNRQIIVGLSATTCALFVMALVWQGGVKFDWRNKLTTGVVVGSPTDKAGAFISTVDDGIARFDLGTAVESLAERTSAGPAYFSAVLERVPATVPHENGALVLRALQLTFQPRFLFPDKPNLGSDSWLVRKYAGLWVGGDELGTSIGLGYMAELYIDFGIPGMLVALFVYGLIIGLAYVALGFVSPSYTFYIGALTIMFGQHFVSYEGEIAKLLGGLVQTVIIFSLLLKFVGPYIHRRLLVRGSSSPRAYAGIAPQVNASHIQ
jgi:hypothetical protein